MDAANLFNLCIFNEGFFFKGKGHILSDAKDKNHCVLESYGDTH